MLQELKRLAPTTPTHSQYPIDALFPDEGPLRRDLYPKHLSFFALGTSVVERAFIAGNRVGKTIVGGYETCLHLTGHYPEWWPGHRFTSPVDWWACGDTSQTTRDIVQQTIIGPIGREHEGLGLLKSNTIIDMRRKSHGVRDAYETIYVRHLSGGTSVLGLKSYDQRRISFQGTKKHGIWDDEEPPVDVYSEQMLRITDTSGGGEPGMLLGTFTPLMGMTDVVMRFISPEVVTAA